jgi:hypothetical protein
MLDNFNYTRLEKTGAMINMRQRLSEQDFLEYIAPYIQNIKKALILRNLNEHIID